MNVVVDGYRHLIEPPERGDCQDLECRTVGLGLDSHPVSAQLPENLPVGADWSEIEAQVGHDLLLVAKYSAGGGWISVCSTCDERRLRAWLEAGQ
jgi:hypothetical protein